MIYHVEKFYDLRTYTLSYVVYDQESKDSLIIDSVQDYDQASGEFWYESADKLVDFCRSKNLKVHYILETHAHADHLSASVYLKAKFPGSQVGISSKITTVQETFKGVFNLSDLTTDGSQFDLLFHDNQHVEAGTVSFTVLETPGHTPACLSFSFTDDEKSFVFTGDALFMPDYGTGRCDFPEGSAEDLYASITNSLYTLADDTMVFVGHDYCPGGRELKYQTTIGESKLSNVRLKEDTSREEFVTFRTERDAKLNAPKLLLPSIQVNINGGKMPAAEDNDVSYLKIPLSSRAIK